MKQQFKFKYYSDASVDKVILLYHEILTGSISTELKPKIENFNFIII